MQWEVHSFTWLAEQSHPKVDVVLLVVDPLGSLAAHPHDPLADDVEVQA